MINSNPHYQAIKHHYGAEKAKRSGQPLINHIDEGLLILEELGSSLATKEAFCLHPLVQSPPALKSFLKFHDLRRYNPHAMILAMEYRNKANAYLCRPKTDDYKLENLPVMVLHEVSDMLIADKVQNYKDFLQYHKESHDRSGQLDRYFKLWLEHLGVSVTEAFALMGAPVKDVNYDRR